ncbi:SDR family oxidoreductase [Candidatus Pelagibacter sp.]|nr:SDR family oxidoreductase [Candidatus Pelagibacter sp.]
MSEKYLIFGATGSVGSSLAEQLKNSGNDIHLVARNESEVKTIAEKLGCSYTVADVLEDGFIEKVKSDINDIKGIAYCVGSIDLKPLRMVTEADMNKCMKLNLYSAIEAIKGFQESLKKNKGSVVLFSTVAAQRGFTNHTIIASAKAAVEGLTVTLAAEFAPNIRVNCIAPSLSKSKIAEPMLKNPAIAEGIAKAHPLKRLGEGKDSAALAKFLITEESSWVTGQVIAVAVALGAQDLFKNLISGILVLVEKRFKIGDWILVEGIIEGIVEKIGFRSTVLRKFDKSLAIIPNFQFAENAVINISETTNWRIDWAITLQYDTTVDQLKKIRNEIEDHINKNDDFDKAVGVAVRVEKFSDSSIDMRVRCFTTSNSFSTWLEVKEKLAIEIKQIVEGNKAAFAFPSQSIYIEKK